MTIMRIPRVAVLGALVLTLSIGVQSSIAQEPLPPTMGPPTATPTLPEEGGPDGGVFSGHLYVDTDGDGRRSDGDGALPGTVQIDLISDPSRLVGTVVSVDQTGRWEARSLPDGTYRILWEPPVRDPADLTRTIPPAQEVVLNPIRSVTGAVLTAEIRDASRTYDLDMGMPYQPPLPGPPISAPQTTAVVPPTPEGRETVAASVEIRLAENRNDSAAPDSGISSPSEPTLVELIPWSRTTEAPGVYDPAMVILGGITAADGTMTFVDTPADTYTLRIWWAAGFVQGGSPTVRDVYQVVFSIDGRGTFGAVDETKYMPGVLGDAQDQRKKLAAVGAPPSEILLNRKPDGLFPYPVGTGGSLPVAVGVLDVAAALSGEPVTLPDTGAEPRQRQSHLELILLGALALMGGAAAFVTLRRT